MQLHTTSTGLSSPTERTISMVSMFQDFSRMWSDNASLGGATGFDLDSCEFKRKEILVTWG